MVDESKEDRTSTVWFGERETSAEMCFFFCVRFWGCAFVLTNTLFLFGVRPRSLNSLCRQNVMVYQFFQRTGDNDNFKKFINIY